MSIPTKVKQLIDDDEDQLIFFPFSGIKIKIILVIFFISLIDLICHIQLSIHISKNDN